MGFLPYGNSGKWHDFGHAIFLLHNEFAIAWLCI